MPGTPRKTPSNDGNRDIRQFTSPTNQNASQVTRQRNRRIIESSSSSSSSSSESEPQAANAVQEAVSKAVPCPICVQPEVMTISSDSSDDMYIPLTLPSSQQQATQRAAKTPPQSRQRPKLPTPPSEQRKRQRATPRGCRSQLFGQAEESASDSESSSSQADETDENAAELYRATMLGIRNRGSALQQRRQNTMPCPVCHQFMEFLKHFI